MADKNKGSLNEALKRREAEAVGERTETFDDFRRVRMLSPGQLVSKRFFRNKLALVGLWILIIMFLFAFIGPLFYGYSQTEIFYKYDRLEIEYASASERTDYVSYVLDGAPEIHYSVLNSMNAYIREMEASGSKEYAVVDPLGLQYTLKNSGENVYILTKNDPADSGQTPVLVASTFVFDACDPGRSFSDVFKSAALLALYAGGEFTADGETYTILAHDGGILIRDASGADVAALGTFVVRRYSGEDTLSITFKEKAQAVIAEMDAKNLKTSAFTFSLPEMDAAGNYVYDGNGSQNDAETDITVTRETGQYVLRCEQVTRLIDIYAPPSPEHLLGTDGDGMDILARMMYGGRISLMVGFVVVILESLLGVIMGGIAGFFGGWVDTLIMRLVDIFYCIPIYPILIIMGAFFDAILMNPYLRLLWMMAILGFLGWAACARLVRGQILSLREQEFMIAEEATGIRASRRIFRHLVPNVMPQLIVNATMGLGSVIITESTLSFLGLGVKHPLATWGTMINSVTSSTESMIGYAYIWVPVGLLICLTVIAFNFVGDGLRDAFDPKMTQ